MGFPKSLFAFTPPDFLNCGMCNDTLKDPVLVCPDHHILCRECVNFVTYCPHCQVELDHDSRHNPDINLSRLIVSLVVKCTHADEGCPWTGTISSQDDHATLCQFARSKCPNPNCTTVLLNVDLEAHVKTCSHTLYPCTNAPHCKRVSTQTEMFKHGLSCEHNPCTWHSLDGCPFRGVCTAVAEHQVYCNKIHAELDGLRLRAQLLQSRLENRNPDQSRHRSRQIQEQKSPTAATSNTHRAPFELSASRDKDANDSALLLGSALPAPDGDMNINADVKGDGNIHNNSQHSPSSSFAPQGSSSTFVQQSGTSQNLQNTQAASNNSNDTTIIRRRKRWDRDMDDSVSIVAVADAGNGGDDESLTSQQQKRVRIVVPSEERARGGHAHSRGTRGSVHGVRGGPSRGRGRGRGNMNSNNRGRSNNGRLGGNGHGPAPRAGRGKYPNQNQNRNPNSNFNQPLGATMTPNKSRTASQALSYNKMGKGPHSPDLTLSDDDDDDEGNTPELIVSDVTTPPSTQSSSSGSSSNTMSVRRSSISAASDYNFHTASGPIDNHSHGHVLGPDDSLPLHHPVPHPLIIPSTLGLNSLPSMDDYQYLNSSGGTSSIDHDQDLGLGLSLSHDYNHRHHHHDGLGLISHHHEDSVNDDTYTYLRGDGALLVTKTGKKEQDVGMDDEEMQRSMAFALISPVLNPVHAGSSSPERILDW